MVRIVKQEKKQPARRPAFLRMREEELRLITGERASAALGSSGTGSGTRTCDGTIVHCCFKDVVIKREGASYVLQVPDGVHKIELERGGAPVREPESRA